MRVKDRFILVDAVGVDRQRRHSPLDREPASLSSRLIKCVACGVPDEDTLSTLAARLARLDQRLTPASAPALLKSAANPPPIVRHIVAALDPDQQRAAPAPARHAHPKRPSPGRRPTARRRRRSPRSNPALRLLLLDAQRRSEIIDVVSQDSARGRLQAARSRLGPRPVDSFRAWITRTRTRSTPSRFSSPAPGPSAASPMPPSQGADRATARCPAPTRGPPRDSGAPLPPSSMKSARRHRPPRTHRHHLARPPRP